MTERPPSAEAQPSDIQHLLDSLDTDVALHLAGLAARIKALIAQRVIAETERWQNRDRQRLEQISTLQETVQSFQSAQAERSASPRTNFAPSDRTDEWDFEHARKRPAPTMAPSALASTGERPASAPSAETLEALRAAIEAAGPGTVTIGRNALGPTIVITTSGYDTKSEYVLRAGPILAVIAAAAAERDAAAIRAFGQRAWSDSEEVAYQAGVSDTLARLQEPDVKLILTLARVICPQRWSNLNAGEEESEKARARATLTKIAEMLK